MRLLNLRKRNKGFTLVELLVVVLILAILMAVALPLYLSAVSDSQKKTCRANMQTIANAEQAYRVKNNAHVYTTSLSTLVSGGDLQGTPACPIVGTSAYTVSGDTTAGITISCPSHGTFVPGLDNQ